MARKTLDPPAQDRTTIVASKHLLDVMSYHVKKNGDNQTNFITRAIVNQLEREGNLTIRKELEEESHG